MLAEFLRTDHQHLQALQPSSEAAQELKYLTEDYRRHVRQQTRLVNQLTATLKAYYPRALEVSELTTALARQFLQAYPTPVAVAALTAKRWQRWASAHRLSDARTQELWGILQRPQLPVPDHVVRAKARLMLTLVEELTVLAPMGCSCNRSCRAGSSSALSPGTADGVPGCQRTAIRAAAGTTECSSSRPLGPSSV